MKLVELFLKEERERERERERDVVSCHLIVNEFNISAEVLSSIQI